DGQDGSRASSDLGVDAQRENVRRPPVPVVPRIENALVPDGERPELIEAKAVERLEDPLAAVVEPPIPEEESQPPRGQIITMGAGQAVQVARDAELVLRTAPRSALHEDSRGKRSVDLGEHEGFGLAVVPAGANVGADVLGGLNLRADAEAPLRLRPSHGSDVWSAGRPGYCQRLVVRAGRYAILESKQPDDGGLAAKLVRHLELGRVRIAFEEAPV